ncbi:bifunctional UDP-N-acetylglucosamine diphosphorylase/glucosamine-1-phosphate N-acetyltransferase GlmU [Serpentinicella alkaliphila]|uniref:Bifunctional protein GlmU n=1 Tax=Serpentinicella alkaliphila TaxID=1734049 RepID=A0A4R2TEG9_9FIRM|nr:bifunctional UDP-N-acetylglucosamine diphosphorylase/glucosamine-1-phosphate N-acetyltransferase GlmU [Serpentinicella alkaliphila]QUH25083.1 bifunctional UDP-N-acetylglucosamine diphosphorylase/glucosamine-1-phosphate N-acetyltransferase GlmU [Serpentinicella alkaliphila]TCQ01728.1 UDP-N-acetylglucosamine pyrophosphorylase /glucosamine-1-phosphate N-acetyltransferase [Serpentinicella alkaliphila]
MKMQAIILAAGAGTRMKSKLPKVLHKVCGDTMLNHVIDSAFASNVDECIVIVGHGADEVRKTLDPKIKTVLQKEQLGTGHALKMAYDEINNEGTVLILCGDGPLVSEDTIKELIHFHETSNAKATVMSTSLHNPYGYGRIIRTESNELAKIVEEKDANSEQKLVAEVNSGTYCFDASALKKALPLLKNDNAQREYYLPDTLAIIKEAGEKVGVYKIDDFEDIMAVNSRVQLAEVEAIMRKRINEKHMTNGVTLIDPKNTYIDKGVKIGQDTIVYPNVFLSGETVIGEDCVIGYNTKIHNSQIGNGVEIQSSTILDSTVDEDTTIGPYAYLRPNSKIGKRVKIGDFVEVKNSTIDDDSKASHLAYIGDGEVGKNVNIGCGVVFVNYDGKNKHKTVVKDNAFVGSNANLVAPVTIEESAYVASGSTITKNVPQGSLAVERSKQTTIEGWVERKNRGRQ